jgi:peptide/nickel transport system substrate-binding protein
MIFKLAINHKKEPFSDVRFRMALAYAIDRQSLVDNVLRGFGVAASPGLYSPESDWYNPNVDQYDYDPTKAGDLLTEMGYTKDGQFFSKDGNALEVELLIDSFSERAGELIKQQLEAAGIKVNLRSVEYKTLDSLVGDWKFDLALMGHGGMGGDPQSLNGIIGEGWSFASSRYSEDEELNQLLASQVSELDQEKRKALIDRIQVVHAQDLPALPLYYSTSYWAHDGLIDLFYSKRGVANGIPIALNKISFLGKTS